MLNLKNKFFILVMTLSPLICAFITPPVSVFGLIFAVLRICVFAAAWILFVTRVCDTKKKLIFTIIYWSFLILSFLYMFLFVNFDFSSISLIIILLFTSVLLFPFNLLGEILSGTGFLRNKFLNIELSYIFTLILMIAFFVFIIHKFNNIERKTKK